MNQDEMVAVFLVKLAENGIPPDVQELLVNGDMHRGIAPGALEKSIVHLIREMFGIIGKQYT